MTTPNYMMLNEFRIEKSLLPVSLRLMDGQVLNGDVFVQASARHRFEQEDAIEVMNNPSVFFPLRLSNGTTVLISKIQVREVHVAADHSAPPDWSVGVPTPVRIQLLDGAEVEGKLCVDPMPRSARALDYLNRATDRFLPVYRTDGLVLVALSQVVLVRQLVDAAT
ncbi:MAG: hypothetical protein MNPFHGCM_00592 [Gemmatimonadaceae bacterium]|nr:hypothetical protein [Gemmatimonadaceae bacterium]